ncbi:MAG TPA: hypothetical protein VMV04_00670 [Thermodesulfobacteriota bacterium]|nr:hypothetical protein [Thermodesulfobacteriota bacterium]
MKLIGITIGIIIAVAVIFFISRHRSASIESRNYNYYVNLCVPLSESKPFNPEDLARAFKEMWGIAVICADDNELGRKFRRTRCNESLEANLKGYVISEGVDKNNLLLAWNSKPLSKERTEVLVQASDRGFTNRQIISVPGISSLRNHKAYFDLDYIRGPDDPKERMLFTAKLLLTLSKRYPVCGYVDSSAQSYTPLPSYPSGIFDKREITLTDLFRLFVNVQTISGTTDTEIHTHGMDQFWLPDLQIICPEEELSRDFDVLRNAAIYMIHKGRPLEVGGTGELAGDGRLFKIAAIKPDDQHPFGFYGAISLRRQ